jgi:hypothetical protein
LSSGSCSPFCWAIYLAWRAIRGGFERPQSAKLNGYGIFACILVFILAMSWIAHVVG